MTDYYLVPGASLLDGLAMSRAQELIDAGHDLVSGQLNSDLPTNTSAEVTSAYKGLREDGEKVHQARLAYLNERLNRGEHPDTHPNFWSEWQEPPLPVLKRVPRMPATVYQWVPVVATGVAALAITALVGVGAWRLFRRRTSAW